MAPKKPLTRAGALKISRERGAARLALEQKLIELAADWEQGMSIANVAVTAMYDLGLSRADIADRLDVPVTLVPKAEELASEPEEEGC